MSHLRSTHRSLFTKWQWNAIHGRRIWPMWVTITFILKTWICWYTDIQWQSSGIHAWNVSTHFRFFFPSGKKDFLKLISKWNKKEKVWAVKHQSSECGRSQLEFSVHLPSTDIATSRSGKKKEKKTCVGTRHALQGGLNKGYNTLT